MEKAGPRDLRRDAKCCAYRYWARGENNGRVPFSVIASLHVVD